MDPLKFQCGKTEDAYEFLTIRRKLASLFYQEGNALGV